MVPQQELAEEQQHDHHLLPLLEPLLALVGTSEQRLEWQRQHLGTEVITGFKQQRQRLRPPCLLATQLVLQGQLERQ